VKNIYIRLVQGISTGTLRLS